MARPAIDHSRLYENLQLRAHHDSLTGLPNRVLFEDRLERALHQAVVLGQKLALLFVDMDGFKEINDTYGHRAGDIYLREVADRMKRAMRPGDTVARVDGDEFTVIAAGISEIDEAEAIASRILQAIREPMMIEGRNIAASASIGIAVFPDDGTSAEQLQREADAAMYSAKDLGRNRIQLFAAPNDGLDKIRLTEDLRLGLP